MFIKMITAEGIVSINATRDMPIEEGWYTFIGSDGWTFRGKALLGGKICTIMNQSDWDLAPWFSDWDEMVIEGWCRTLEPEKEG